MDLPFVYGGLFGGELGNAMGVSETRIRASAAKATKCEKKPSPKHAYTKLLQPIINQRSKRRKDDAAIVNLAESLQNKVALSLKECGRVVSFSGCTDSQRCAETFSRVAGTSSGAMTHAFISAIHSARFGTPECTLDYMLQCMRDVLKRSGHAQVPQLCCSHDGMLHSQFTV